MTYEILNITKLHKTYGAKLILDDLQLALNRGERAALVGENGTGKTTLARIIVGLESADSGTIRMIDGARVGYLPQEVTTADERTIQAYIEQAVGELHTLKLELTALEQQMSQFHVPDELNTLLERYGTVQAEFEQRGGYDLDYRRAAIFAGLAIEYLDVTRPLYTLSGGEKTRVALAALLLQAPDLLVLDEPTNHLDFSGIAWLENYLAEYPHALLLITHDRHFLNKVANQIIELSPVTHALKTYYGNYEDYLAQREADYEAELAAYTGQLDQISTLKRQVKMATHNPRTPKIPTGMDGITLGKMKATAQNTLSAKVRDAKQRLTMLHETLPDNPAHRWRIEFAFDPLPLTSNEPMTFEALSKSYGERVLFDRISGVIRKGERIVIAAPNGTGKSTLLQILMGLTTAEAGKVRQVASAKIAYVDQESTLLNPQQTVLECYREVTAGTDRDLLAALHRSGLFSDASLLQKKVAELSVGQRRKLALARVIAARANVLLLDEPTNHLDLPSLEALEAALREFDGAILAVSHDRWFIEHVATQVWELRDGQLWTTPVMIAQ